MEWINSKTEQLQQRPLPENLDGLKEGLAHFVDYKNNEKPGKASEKLALETLFNSIGMKLKSNNRAPFVPAAGTAPSDISKIWHLLDVAEREREEALLKELER